MASSAAGAAMSERDKKKMHEKHEKILEELMQDESNRYCADCGQKGCRWASWNLGVFLCIRCGGIHRKLGTHISRIKSITLDTWTPEQIASIQEKGNSKVNAIYNPHPERHQPPNNDIDMEQYIRDKYERKRFMDGGAPVANNSFNSSAPATNASPSSTFTVNLNSSDEVKYGSEIRKLRDMGFSNTAMVIEALKKARGDIQGSIDILVASGGAAHAEGNRLSAAEESAMKNIKAMGFKDDALSLQILRKHKGRVEDAIQDLLANQPPSPVAPAAQSNPFAAPTTNNNNNAKKNSAVDDLLSLDFGGSGNGGGASATSSNPFEANSGNPFGSNPFDSNSAGMTVKSNTNDILSLYNQPPAQPQNPFAGAFGSNPFASSAAPTNNYPGASNGFTSSPFQQQKPGVAAVNNASPFQPAVNNASPFQPAVNNASPFQPAVNNASPFQPAVNNASSFQGNAAFGNPNATVNTSQFQTGANPFNTNPASFNNNNSNSMPFQQPNPFGGNFGASNPFEMSSSAGNNFGSNPFGQQQNPSYANQSPFAALGAGTGNSNQNPFGQFGTMPGTANPQAQQNDPFAGLKATGFGQPAQQQQQKQPVNGNNPNNNFSNSSNNSNPFF